MATSDKAIPVRMGDKVIAKMFIDKDTGAFEGMVADTELCPLLEELFMDGVLEVSLYGKAGLPFKETREKIDEYLKTGSV